LLQIGLTGFKCRCGYVFCGSHRLAVAHACDFDYKTAGRDNLAKANPLIQVCAQLSCGGIFAAQRAYLQRMHDLHP